MSCKIILLKKNNKIHIYKILLIIYIDINNLRNNLNNKNRRVSSLQNDLNNSEQRNRNLERCINDKRYENDNLNSRLNDMTHEVRSLESRLDNKCQENSKIRSRLDWYLFKKRNEKEEEEKRDVYVCPKMKLLRLLKNILTFMILIVGGLNILENTLMISMTNAGILLFENTFKLKYTIQVISLTIGNYDVELYKCG